MAKDVPAGASAAQAPYTALLRGSLIPTAIAALVCLAIAVPAGVEAILGAATGAVLVLVFFSIGLLVMQRTAQSRPEAVMGVVMLTYVLKVAALAAALVAFRGADWLSTPHFALAALACTAVWLAFEMRAFARLRVLVTDEPSGDGVRGGEGR